jgi:hypothetical protein
VGAGGARRGESKRTSHNFQAIGRLRDGVTVAQAAADLSAIAKDIIGQSPDRATTSWPMRRRCRCRHR